MAQNIIKIAAVGDICPGDKAILGAGVGTVTRHRGTDFIFDKINSQLLDSDIVIGNLEGVLSYNDTLSSVKTFCGLKEFASSLKKSNFKVISMANNHTMEHGCGLFNETVEILTSNGLLVCGTRGHGDYYSEPVIIEQNGTKIGLIAYNWVSKDSFKNADDFLAQSHDSLVNYTWDRTSNADQISHFTNKNAINDIRKLKKEVDIVIFLPHWGYEFTWYPPFGVTCEAKAFIDAGADLIIGSHPHVLQGYEQYRGKWIFYSLGNFVFDMRYKKTKECAILHYTLTPNENDTFSFLACKSNNNFQPEPITQADEKKIYDIIKKSSDAIQCSDRNRILNDNLIYAQFEKNYSTMKLIHIIHHFTEIFKHPTLSLLIMKKTITFLQIIAGYVTGKRVRW